MSAQNTELKTIDTIDTLLIQVKYESKPQNDAVFTNAMLDEIAKSIPKSIYYTQFQCLLQLNGKFTQLNTKNGELVVTIPNFSCQGDINYKGFSLNNLLTPSIIRLNYSFLSENYIVLNKLDEIVLQKNQENKYLQKFSISDSSISKYSSIKLTQWNYEYNTNDVNTFLEYCQFINNYYRLVPKLIELKSKLDAIDLDKTEQLPLYKFDLRDIEMEYLTINQQQIIEKLNLTKNDPARFILHYDSLTVLLNQKRVILNQLLSTIDYAYYRKGISYLQQTDTITAISFFQKSIDVNPYYVAAHYQLALIDFQRNNINESVERLESIFNNMRPDDQFLELSKQLINKIYFHLLGKAQSYILKETFNEAIEILEYSKVLCNKCEYVNCSDELSLLLAKAKYGIYHSYIVVASKAIEIGNLRIANNLLIQAKTYQLNNQAEIITAGEADKMLIKLAEAYVANANSLNVAGNYDKALEFLNAALEICELIGKDLCPMSISIELKNARMGMYAEFLKKAKLLLQEQNITQCERELDKAYLFAMQYQNEIQNTKTFDSLMNIVKSIRFAELVELSRKELVYGIVSKAITMLDEAIELKRKYYIVAKNDFDSLVKAAAFPYILQKIQYGKLKAWASDLDSAQLIAKDVVILQNKYNIVNDSILQIQLNLLFKKINEQKCIMVADEYENKMFNIHQQAKNKDFIQVASLLLDVKSYISENINCNIDTIKLYQAEQLYQVPIKYVNLINSFDKIVESSDFLKFIDAYNQSEQSYQTNNIEKFGIEKFNLLAYFLKSINYQFIAFGVHYFTSNNDLKEAMELLKYLKKLNYPVKYTKTLQENLGKATAIRDKKQNPAANPKANLIVLVANDKYFRVFKNSYLKNW